MNKFEINGHAVVASFDVQDLRDGAIGLGMVQVLVSMTIDGKADFLVLLQNDNDGVLEIADSASGNDDNHDAVHEAMGGKGDFSDMISSIIEAAQEEFDSEIIGKVLNENKVSEEEAVTDFVLGCNCGYNYHTFDCDGDGYITLRFNSNERQFEKFRISEEIAGQLSEIKESTESSDPHRTLRVFEIFHPQ